MKRLLGISGIVFIMVAAVLIVMGSAALARPRAAPLADPVPEYSSSVIATIPLDTPPWGIGVNPTTNRIYVSNSWINSVSVISGDNNSVVTTVAAGTQPWGVGVNPTTNHIYVANQDSDNVSVINGATNTVVATVSVGDGPDAVGVNPTTNRIYVTNYNRADVSVIDGTTDSVVAMVKVGCRPLGIGVNPDTDRVYVANWACNTVSVIAELPPPGVVTGRVDLQGRSDDGGALITLSGSRPYSGITAADGAFTITGVAAGVYTATAAMSGYLYAQKSGIVVTEGGTTTLPTVTLPGGDFTDDGVVNIFDLVLVGINYGMVGPISWP